MPRAIRRQLFSTVAVTLVACLATAATAPVASAETIGGERLSSTHRTVSLLPGAQPLPDIWAETWIIADARSGAVLAQKGSHVQRAPASTLKMLTALTVLPRTSPDDVYRATARAAGIYGARVGLRPGREYTLKDLWYAVFLPSANDAAIAVAEANGGVRRTIRQMNAVARSLRANDTVAKTTSGLDAPGQVSSAYDLALIARAGLQREDFSHYASATRATFPNVKGKKRHPIYSTNRLLRHGFKGMIGVKTGFTSQAGRTYVGAATRGKTTLIVAMMGIHQSTESAAKALLKWGFANRKKVLPVGELVEPIADASLAASLAAEPTGDSAPVNGSAVTASAPTEPSQGVPSAVVWAAGAVALLAATGSVLATRARRRRPYGRHAART